MRGGLLLAMVLLAACGKPKATLEVERQVTIVSPPPAGVAAPPQAPGVVVGTPGTAAGGAPPAAAVASPPSTVPLPTSRPSSWVHGEKR